MLDEAIMWRADLQDAALTGAHLHETHLERANLAGARGLTWEQGEDAFTDENTVLPNYLLPDEVRPTSPTAGTDNVVQLQATPSAEANPAETPPKPKKAAVSRRRKPGLVNPA